MVQMFYRVSFQSLPPVALFFFKTCAFFWLDSKIHCGPNFQNPCLDGPIHRVFFYLLLERFLYTIQRYERELKNIEKSNGDQTRQHISANHSTQPTTIFLPHKLGFDTRPKIFCVFNSCIAIFCVCCCNARFNGDPVAHFLVFDFGFLPVLW